MSVFNRGIDMTSGGYKQFFKKVVLYSLPIIFVGVLEILFNTFDLISIESKEGDLSASAVGANAAMTALLTNVFIGLSTGENVVMAKHYGAGDHEGALRCAYSGICLALIAGILVMTVGYFMTPTLLRLMKASDDYFDLAVKYMQTYFFAMPFMALYNFGSATFRGMGDSKTPLIFLVIAGIIHVALDFLFVYPCNLSVIGVGLSNIISYLIAAVLVIVFLRTRRSFIDFRFKTFRFYKAQAWEILRIGIPSGLEGMVFAISNVLLQSTVNTWGSLVVEANADCESIENFVYTTTFSIAQGGAAFVSANYAVGNKKNVKELLVVIETVIFSFGLSLGLILLALNRQLVGIYTGFKATEQTYALCLERLSLLLPTYCLCGLMDGTTNALRGLNRPLIPMIITILFLCGFRILWNFCVYSPDPSSSMHSTLLLYVCYPITWVCSLSFQLCYLFIERKKISAEMDKNAEKLDLAKQKAQPKIS